MLKLERIFNAVYRTAYELRRINPNYDGKAFWQPIKKMLDIDGCRASKWKTVVDPEKFDKIMSLPEYHIDGYGEKHINESNHFLIQCVRIPSKEPPSLKKIIQIALNLGQYKAVTGEELDPNFNELRIYIKEEDIIKISDQISEILLDDILAYLSSKCPCFPTS